VPNQPGHSRPQSGFLPPALAACVCAAQKLVEVPVADRDLAWHVKAAYFGDLNALASAAILAESLPRAA
jgi:hypothetical protein